MLSRRIHQWALWALWGLLVAVTPAHGYWAKLDTSGLKNNYVKITSQSDRPLRCALRAYHDTAFVELSPHQSSSLLNVKEGVKRWDLSLRCEPIEKVTRLSPWRQIRHIWPQYHTFVFK
jgi:hypothetical protein